MAKAKSYAFQCLVKIGSTLDHCIKIDTYFGFCACSVVFPVAKLPGELAGL